MDPNLKTQDYSEINQALKEFEEKSTREGADLPPSASTNADVPKMVGLVMKWSGGTIQKEQTAQYILIGFVVVAITISVFLVLGNGANKTDIPPSPLSPLNINS